MSKFADTLWIVQYHAEQVSFGQFKEVSHIYLSPRFSETSLGAMRFFLSLRFVGGGVFGAEKISHSF